MKSFTFFKTLIILVIINVISVENTNAQNYPDTAIFEEKQIPYFFRDLTPSPPKITIDLLPVTGIFTNGIGFGYTGAAFIRPLDYLIIDGRFTSTYGRTEDQLGPDEQKSYIDYQVSLSTRIFQYARNARKMRKLVLSTDSVSPVTYKNFVLEYNPLRITSYYLTGGANYNRTAGRTQLVSLTGENDIYYAGNLTALSYIAGITRERIHYATFASPFRKRTKYRYFRVRNYLLATYAPSPELTVFSFHDEKNGISPASSETKIVNSGFSSPEIVKFGWKFGAEAKVRGLDAHNSVFFGFEFGKLPSLNVPNAVNHYNQFFMMIRSGIEIGVKPRDRFR